ncbi:spore coat protein U domain-containing protein [Sphingomonas sp. NCPPB 2930]
MTALRSASGVHRSPRRRLRGATAAAAALGLLAAGGSPAATLTGELVSTITLSTGCLIVNGVTGVGNNVNLGTLDFGSRPSTFVGPVSATVTGGSGGSGVTQVLCSPDVSGLTITVNGGGHAGSGTAIGPGSRAMSNGTAFVPYEIFQDPGHTATYAIGQPLGVTIPAAGSAFNLPIYGLVNKTSTSALPSGTYVDTVIVTLTF